MPVTEIQSSSELTTAADDRYRLDSAQVDDVRARPAKTTMGVARCATLLAIIVSLCFLEVTARIVVGLGKPVNFSTSQFDAKYWDAVNPRDTLPHLFFLGTSHVSNGVYTDLISWRLQQKGYRISASNLGCPWGLPLDELFLLREAMAHGVKPAAVIYEVEYIGFAGSGRGKPDYSPPLKQSYMGYLVAKRDSPIAEFWYKLKKHSYLVRYRRYLYQTFSSFPDMLLQRQWMGTSSITVGRETSPQGWVPLYSCLSPERTNKHLEEQKKIFGGASFMPVIDAMDRTKLQNYSVRPVYEFCKSNHIPLILLRMPVHHAYAEMIERLFRVPHDRFEDAFAKQSAIYNVPMLDMSDDNDDAHFSDGDHLSAVGAISTSERIERAFEQSPYDSLLREYKAN